MFKHQSGGVFVRRRDAEEEEFFLDASGLQCTCPYFVKSQLPCQHIFAFRYHAKQSLFNEALIPERYRVFGKCITLESLAEAVKNGGGGGSGDGAISSTQRMEKVSEVQGVVGEILSVCRSSLSVQGISTAVTQLANVLAALKVGLLKWKYVICNFCTSLYSHGDVVSQMLIVGTRPSPPYKI